MALVGVLEKEASGVSEGGGKDGRVPAIQRVDGDGVELTTGLMLFNKSFSAK
jgi:hypothetical protein